MFKLDRDRYIQIVKSQGLSAAITALHRDTNHFEFETFEGKDGYKPENWEALEQVRAFSRELWNIALTDQMPAARSK